MLRVNIINLDNFKRGDIAFGSEVAELDALLSCAL